MQQKVTIAGQTLEKRESLYTVGGNVNGAVPMENSMVVPEKIKNRNTIYSQSHFWVYIQKN